MPASSATSRSLATPSWPLREDLEESASGLRVLHRRHGVAPVPGAYLNGSPGPNVSCYQGNLRRVVLLLSLTACEQILGISEPRDFQDANGTGVIDSASVVCAEIPTYGAATKFGAAGNSRLAVGDLDHDGVRDVAVVTATDVLIFGGASGGSLGAPRSMRGTATSATDLLIADLDGDGFNDLVTWSGATVTIHRQNTTTPGTFLTAQSFSVAEPIGDSRMGPGVRTGRLNG